MWVLADVRLGLPGDLNRDTAVVAEIYDLAPAHLDGSHLHQPRLHLRVLDDAEVAGPLVEPGDVRVDPVPARAARVPPGILDALVRILVAIAAALVEVI